jgi:hypothetical protein
MLNDGMEIKAIMRIMKVTQEYILKIQDNLKKK